MPYRLYGCTQLRKKKEKLQKRKVLLQRTNPQRNDSDTIRTTPVVLHSNNNAFKKETVPKRRRCPTKGHRFSPWRKSLLTKQCLQQDHCQAQPTKARPWIFTLQDKTG